MSTIIRDASLFALSLGPLDIALGGTADASATITPEAIREVQYGVSTAIDTRLANPACGLVITVYPEDAAYQTLVAMFARAKDDPTFSDTLGGSAVSSSGDRFVWGAAVPTQGPPLNLTQTPSTVTFAFALVDWQHEAAA